MMEQIHRFVARTPPLMPPAPILACLLACALPVAAAAAPGIVDDEGLAVRLEAPSPRIVSLAPGATAMLFAAGAGGQIVGTSDYSDEPAAARRIERVGDARGFDVERLLTLHPDVVVVWSGGTSAAQIDRLQRLGLPVYRHRIERIADIPASVRRLGRLAGTEARAAEAADALTSRIAMLRERYAGRVHDSVLIQVWDHPIYTVGGSELLSDVLGICGYRNVFGELGASAPAVSLESVLARDPDLILAIGSSGRTAVEWAQAWDRFPTLKSVRTHRVIPWTDPRLSRLGPSMIEASAALCAVLSRDR